MLNHLRRHWRAWVLTILAYLMAWALVASSDTFQECMNAKQDKASGEALKEGVGFIIRSLSWQKSCTGDFLRGNGEAITALFTVILSFSTILLWKVTARLATTGDRALTELEAPVIAVKIIDTGISQSAITGVGFDTLTYSLVNYGRTPGTLYELIDDVRSCRVGEEGPAAITGQRGPAMPYGVFIPPNGGETRPFRIKIYASQIGAAPNDDEPFKKITPFFLGIARYGDIFGNLYTMGFCFIFDDTTDRFIESGHSGYNYCSKKRGPYIPTGIEKNFPIAAG